LQTTSQNLLQHLSLLFVPAGTGIMVPPAPGGRRMAAAAALLLISTLATLVVTALVMKLCQRAPTAPGEAP
jgi:holin-like protein